MKNEGGQSEFKEILTRIRGLHLLNGFIREASRVCGKKNCRCMRGQLHPRRMVYGYYQDRKSHFKAIPRDQVLEVQQAIRRFKLLSEGLSNQIKLSRRKLLRITPTGPKQWLPKLKKASKPGRQSHQAFKITYPHPEKLSSPSVPSNPP